MPDHGPFENLHLAVSEGVATVTVTRPKALNALNAAVFDELERAFTGLREDAEVRAIVVTGSGDKAFVAGADIVELAELGPEAAQATSARGQGVFNLIERCGKPVVAAVNGFALGGGLELALACHVRVASDNARLGLPEVTLALIPGYGGTQRLARLVGVGRALEMVLTGDMIDAAAAERCGLVSRVVPQAELAATAMKIARRIASRGPVALRLAMTAVLDGVGAPLEAGLAREADLFGQCFATDDMREGTRAFLEKRKPTYRGT